MNAPTGCICGVSDLTERGHEFGCPMYLRDRQQDNWFYREPNVDPLWHESAKDSREGWDAAVRLARTLHEIHYGPITTWRPLPTIAGVISQIDNLTAGMVKVGTLYGLRGALAELEESRSFNSTEKALFRVVDHAKAIALYQPISPPKDRYANDAAAKVIYDTWRDQPGWVQWEERGNSFMQQRARDEVGQCAKELNQ